MTGNVWEWTRSLGEEHFSYPELGYPYDPHDGREDPEASYHLPRVLRGGAFCNDHWDVRCAFREGLDPVARLRDVGFRVVVLP
jgi:formylglycine-generating enzyme required for sulfatase activity